MLEMLVEEDFISHRMEKMDLYNQRGRSNRSFCMAIDCELVEFEMIKQGIWQDHPSWMVDAVDQYGYRIDVKFIRKYWNVSREKTLNVLKQYDTVDQFAFYEWVDRPRRPLELGDSVGAGHIGNLSYYDVVNGLRKSFKEPDGFYLDAREILRSNGEMEPASRCDETRDYGHSHT